MTKINFRKRNRVSIKFAKPSLTQQHLKDQCDINRIVKKAMQTGLFDHIKTAQAQYGDVSEIQDYQTALNTVIKAQGLFEALPSEVREEFANDPARFVKFCQNEKNQDKLIEMGLATKKVVAPSVEVSNSTVVETKTEE